MVAARGAVAIAALGRPKGFVPGVALTGRDFGGEVHVDEAGPGAGKLGELSDVRPVLWIEAQGCGLRAGLAEAARKTACVDAGDAGQTLMFQPPREVGAGAMVGRLADGSSQDHAPCMTGGRLEILGVGADIADVRKGEGDELPGVGGVAQDLLIARHGGVVNVLADHGAGWPQNLAAGTRAIS